jgi:hypothetical protein
LCRQRGRQTKETIHDGVYSVGSLPGGFSSPGVLAFQAETAQRSGTGLPLREACAVSEGVQKRISHRNGNAGGEIGKIVSLPLGHPPSFRGKRRRNGPLAVAVRAAKIGTPAQAKGTTEEDRDRPNRFHQGEGVHFRRHLSPAPAMR